MSNTAHSSLANMEQHLLRLSESTGRDLVRLTPHNRKKEFTLVWEKGHKLLEEVLVSIVACSCAFADSTDYLLGRGNLPRGMASVAQHRGQSLPQLADDSVMLRG